MTKIFCFRIWNMGSPIEWGHGGDHFCYSDRSVNSAFSWSYRADRALPFQILSLAQERKNWAPGPPISRLRVMGRRGPIYSTTRAFVPASLRP